MRKIVFIITSFIHYSRNLLILEELNRREDVDLHIVVGGTALLPKYSSRYAHVRAMLEADGFQNIHELYFTLEGDNAVVKAKTAGLGIVEFSTLFNDIKPDMVVVRADRFEVLAAATAASYMNIPVAHIEGGDLSGTLDECIRHAITKLSHIHIATNNDARERLLRMGEDPRYVFNFGSPDIEVVHSAVQKGESVDFTQTGSGAPINPDEDFLMVMYHTVWQEALEEGRIAAQTKMLLNVVHDAQLPVVWFWPNADVGAEEIAHELRIFRDLTEKHKIRFSRYLPPRMFISLLNKTRVLIGNSSAGIKESSYLGVPVVNIGSRQAKRMRAGNVIDVPYECATIKSAIEEQLSHGKYEPSGLYKADNTSAQIASTLATTPLRIEKAFCE
jgi:UDP-hydrolysing UDP-N-acetyl-D-glucosamine 2-epimerase